MPRQNIDLSPYREDLATWAAEGRSKGEMVQLLELEHRMQVGLTKLTRSLAELGIPYGGSRVTLTPDDEVRVEARLNEFFFELRLTDKETMRLLDREGINLDERQIGRRRQALGLHKRILSADEQERHSEWVREGPNHTWSMDGHCKFEAWGVQRSAAVDLYSRYVTWVYVGISGRTALSVLAQYLATLQDGQIMPRLIRTDRGAETPLAADAHYYLRSVARLVRGQPLGFSECFRYGTSKQNSRVETWWAQQSKSALGRWRAWFIELSHAGEYSSDSRADRIAFLAVYSPILRRTLFEFVSLWNRHRIRSQGNRGYLIPGKPKMLYQCPEMSGGRECGIVPPADALDEYLARQDLQDFDSDEYLPPRTLEWCTESLARVGLNGLDRSEASGGERGDRPHVRAYMHLLENKDINHFLCLTSKHDFMEDLTLAFIYNTSLEMGLEVFDIIPTTPPGGACIPSSIHPSKRSQTHPSSFRSQTMALKNSRWIHQSARPPSTPFAAVRRVFRSSHAHMLQAKSAPWWRWLPRFRSRLAYVKSITCRLSSSTQFITFATSTTCVGRQHDRIPPLPPPQAFKELAKETQKGYLHVTSDHLREHNRSGEEPLLQESSRPSRVPRAPAAALSQGFRDACAAANVDPFDETY